MQGSQPNFITEQRQLFKAVCPTCFGCPLDPQSFCQQQLEQLAKQLPILTAQIVYQGSEEECQNSVIYDTQPGSSFPLKFLDLVWSCPEDEEWAAMQLREVAIAELISSYSTASRKPSLPPCTAYLCSLNSWNARRDYLLLLTTTGLSDWQKTLVEQQAKLLKNYLLIWREYTQQKKDIEALEYALRRTEHQLRNPLSLISLCAENLYLGLENHPLREQALTIRETIDALSDNLTHFLRRLQRERLRVATHDLREVFRESLYYLKPWIGDKQLKINYPDTPFVLAVDRGQMKQVFDNLLSNAIYFSPVGETITCSWKVYQHEALFEIRDQGQGLSEEDLKQVFMPAYSKRPGGTGWGLAIAQKIIQAHQGRLWVQNLPQGGAQFSFALPRNFTATP